MIHYHSNYGRVRLLPRVNRISPKVLDIWYNIVISQIHMQHKLIHFIKNINKKRGLQYMTQNINIHSQVPTYGLN